VPFMTHVIGQVFDAFAQFPLSDATSQDKAALRHDVGIAAIELVALAAGAIAFRSVTSAVWIATGERNVMRLSKKVREAVTTREVEWSGAKMGAAVLPCGKVCKLVLGSHSHFVARLRPPRLRPPGTCPQTCPFLAEATRGMFEDVPLPG